MFLVASKILVKFLKKTKLKNARRLTMRSTYFTYLFILASNIIYLFIFFLLQNEFWHENFYAIFR